MEDWSFENGVSESEVIAHWKENSEGKKMVCSLVAKVEYVMVEMVEKLMEVNGLFS